MGMMVRCLQYIDCLVYNFSLFYWLMFLFFVFAFKKFLIPEFYFSEWSMGRLESMGAMLSYVWKRNQKEEEDLLQPPSRLQWYLRGQQRGNRSLWHEARLPEYNNFFLSDKWQIYYAKKLLNWEDKKIQIAGNYLDIINFFLSDQRGYPDSKIY